MVTPRSTQYPNACPHPRKKNPHTQLPEVIVHGLEKELVIWLLEDILEVGQSDFVRRHRQLHQIRCLLVVEVVDNFGLPHLALRLERPDEHGASSQAAWQAPSRAPTPCGAGGSCAAVLAVLRC